MQPALKEAGCWGGVGECRPNPEKEEDIVTEQLRSLTGIQINETNGTARSASWLCAQKATSSADYEKPRKAAEKCL